MRTDPLPSSVEQYLAGELSEDAAQDVRRYLETSLGGRGLVAGLRAAVRGDAVRDVLDPAIARQEFLARFDGLVREELANAPGKVGTRGTFATDGRTRRVIATSPTMRQRVARNLAIYATVAVVLVGVGMTVVRTIGKEQNPATSANGFIDRVYTTAPGQRAMVTLADGSRVLLGPATTLSVVPRSSEADVELRVRGEARFTITHKQTRPFRVHAGNALVRVLGTTFFVRQYDTDSVARVFVTDGRVSLAAAHSATRIINDAVLTANMLGVVNDSGTVHVTPRTAIEDYTAWTDGRLVFRDTPARDAVLELGRAYDVDIRIPDSTLAAQPLTWTIPLTEQSLTDVLDALADVLDVHTVRMGRVITLVPGRAAVRRSVNPHSLSSERQYGR